MPVLLVTSARLFVLIMAVEDGQCLKQGNYKNIFYQPELPDNELCIVKQLMRCQNLK